MYFGASADWLAVAGPGTTYSSPPYSDYDGDHLNDYAEYWLGSDPTSSDSDGDGLGDRVDRDLGFSPIRANKLLVTQVARTGTGDTTLQWQWVSLPAGTSGQPTELGLLVDYVVERCTSLERPAWMQVSEVLTRMASGEAEVAASAASSDTKWCNGGASGKGGEGTGAAEPEFYRVRAVIDESYLSE
jgi:hypothetical protein